MKKLLLPLLICYQFLSAQSPITFAITDIPAANQSLRVGVDTFPLPSINFGNKGANQFYDFSNLSLFKYDTVEFLTPNNSQLTECPQADVATTNDRINFLLTNTDNVNNKLILEGFQGQLTPGNTITASYTDNSTYDKPEVYRFPTTYQSNFSGNAYLQKSVPGSSVGQPLVSQVRLTITTAYTDTIDGWGIVKTPVGTYKCLRKKRKETTRTQIEAFVIGWYNVSDDTKTTTRYSYLTKEAKGSVVTFNYDTANVLQSVTWATVLPNIPVADFTYVTGAAGLVNFTDASDNATQWSWDFGDGGTSTQQNPSHTYAANGTYNVCLTATNAGGSSLQVCKQVTITNVVAAPVAEFVWVNVSGGLVNFTDQSTNTPTQWAWTFGDAGTSNVQNPNHIYAANGNYNVCLTATNTAGSNQHCETVTVSGITAANSAPFAVTDTVSLTQATSITIYHVANNDIDPDNDQLCMTAVWGSPYVTEYIGGSCDMVSIVPDSNFVGTDTAWYTICDNGSPVLCDTGLLIFTVVANPGLYPTAVNDNATALQPDGTTVNVTQNDVTPVNPVCVTAIYGGGNAFTINGCNNITYTPDSLFTGNDTVWYVVCDNGHATWCDTAMLVVTSNANPALLPVAGFTWQPVTCEGVVFTNTSVNYANATLVVKTLDFVAPDSSYTIISQVHYYGSNPSNAGLNVQACITVSNPYGSSTFCDTAQFYCEGIATVSLNSISLYPNPAQGVVTIDMSRNNDEVTRNYTSIEIYNVVGEKVKQVSGNQAKLVTIPVNDMPDGMYVATLTDTKGVRYTVGRFTVAK